MTLVLSCLTKDAVYQVSDRRLTSSANPNEVIDDERNKAVVVDNRVVFGYTGLAKIGNERSDDWLARVISDGKTGDMAQVALRIKERATQDFQRLNLPDHLKRHAYQGAGWFALRRKGGLSPGIITIDNAIDHRTGAWLANSLSEFQITEHFPVKFPDQFILNSVGVTPSGQEKSAIIRLVGKCFKHRRATFGSVMDSLVRSLQWLSSRDPRIGPGLMAVCLPKNSVEESERLGMPIMIAGGPSDSFPTFLYVSATGSKTRFGPHFVLGGNVLTGFSVEYK